MSCEISCKIENNILVVHFDGAMDRDVVIDTMKAYSQLEGYKPDLNRIWDMRDLSEIFLGKEDLKFIKMFIENNKVNQHSYRVAHVSNRDLVFGISRMFGLMADSLPIKIQAFREYDEALQWVSETVKIENRV